MTSVATRLVRPVLFGLAGIGLAVLVVKGTVGPVLSVSNPKPGPAMFSPDSRPFFRKVAADYAKRRKLSAAAYATAQQIAREQPLASGPYAALAVQALDRGQPQRAIKLLEAGRLRNARDRFVRVLLLEQYARTNAFPKAATELTTLYRLVPDADNVFVDTMTAIALDPAGFDALAHAIHGQSSLGPLLSNLVKVGAPLDRILLLARSNAGATEPEQIAWRGALLQRLIDEQQYGEARRLWASFAKLPATQRDLPFYNLGLARSEALAPFNWRYSGETIGAVDPLGRGGASVSYFGRESGALLSQLMTLKPGKYRFGYAVEGSRSAEGSEIVWHIRCAAAGSGTEAGQVLAEAVIPQDIAGKRAFAVNFTVPSGCNAQWLSLDGVSSEFPTSRTIEISGLTLKGAN